ncbi:unnamed protein product [Adineta steineri]|uniref:SCP domain-containing protein n=1 Tax=Adineta steineri TaxID=433720 RepID=A0A819DBB6_9BILA|nr:unnamed protein product [Adineta steineri]
MQYFTLFCIGLLICIYEISASTWNKEKFCQEVVDQHNAYRMGNCAIPLKRNTTLDAIAQKWSDELASTGKFVHSNTTEYGENSYKKTPFNFDKENGTIPVNAWCSESSNYTVNKPQLALHFTQVVWKNTTMIGVGVTVTKDNGIIVVCNYSPRGNYENQFAKNVGCPQKS